jgi:hypothetical protein
MENLLKEPYANYLRWLYRSGRPNWFARLQNNASALVFGAGIWPERVAALEVVGRRTGRIASFPVAIADLNGESYLVAMLGERTNWVLNVRADGGRAVLRHGVREAVKLVEVPVTERPAIIKRYLEVAPGARPHIPVDRNAPLDEFSKVAERFPVFRIESAVQRAA